MGQLKLIYFEKALQEFFNYYIVKPLLGRPSVQLTPSIKRNFSLIFVTQNVTLNRLSLERKQCPKRIYLAGKP